MMAVGDYGHLCVILSFIASLLSAIGYIKSAVSEKIGQGPWKQFGRINFYVHSLATIGIVVCLFLIIAGHRYEYHYAYDHSNNYLPSKYMISCFWEGQEGSFLLWIFWNLVIGNVLIRTSKNWEAPVMAVFAMVQAFLVSMILGVVPVGDFQLGSSPFILLTEIAENQEFFQMNPGFIHDDGKGLNILLQNYWMVIHPPTLFLGFGLGLVPFSYCIAGLWMKRYTEWVRVAMPWTLFTGAVLTTGIMMGAYWAYETLNFGGYWNWDPVENAVYLPWLVYIATLHAMTTFLRKQKGLRYTIILSMSSYLLILLSTWLTRSGVLGNASVHSFTDSGLNIQLLVYLLFFVTLCVVLYILRTALRNKDKMPLLKSDYKTETGDFYILIGSLLLCLGAFQVLVTILIQASRPIAFVEEIYNYVQLFIAAGITLCSGFAQQYWWKKTGQVRSKSLKITIYTVLSILLLFGLYIIYTMHSASGNFERYEESAIDTTDHVLFIVRFLGYVLLLAFALFSMISNGYVISDMLRRNRKLTGGAIAHVGIALMLLGILFSSGYSVEISDNSGYLKLGYDKAYVKKLSQKSTRLYLGLPVPMDDYLLTYKGMKVEAKAFPELIDYYDCIILANRNYAVTKKDLFHNGKKKFSAGDTLEIIIDKFYHEINYKYDKEEFTLYSSAQTNKAMNGITASPDIKHYVSKDLYTHVNSIPDLENEELWGEEEPLIFTPSDSVIDYKMFTVKLKSIEEVKTPPPGLIYNENDIIIKANLEVSNVLARKTEMAHPLFIIRGKDNLPTPESDFIPEFGLEFTFENIDPIKGEFNFSLRNRTKDYIDVKASEKPLASFVWVGTILTVLGLLLATWRRVGEARKFGKTSK